jgi:para-aminobenzoate synthetase component 1
MNKEVIKDKLNKYGISKTPILFIIDFDINDFFISPLDTLSNDVLYKFENFTNITQHNNLQKISIKKYPISLKEYKKYFDEINTYIKNGYTYLLNLTFPTKINIISKDNISLKEIILNTKSKFKLYFKDKFISFSPERFIQIKNNTILTYPIKGTIDASIKNAKDILIKNKKEISEHTMIVDLLRNDLNKIGIDTKVNSFRDVEQINAGDSNLLQTSSNIQSTLKKGWQDSLGDIILSILPAGSITGTPKKETTKIINKIENKHNNYKRGFFCGICGYFDGEIVDSFVLIRYIEKNKKDFIYKSGGGITIDSNVEDEYKEMLQKVYIPL